MKAKYSIFSMPLLRHYVLIFPIILIVTTGCKKENFSTVYINEVPLPYSNSLPMDSTLFLNGRTSTVVVLGSSTASGVGASSPTLGWVELLKSRLKNDNKIVNVVNLSSGGFTTFHIMSSGSFFPNRPAPDIDRNITAALNLHPFLIIVNIPTNDLATNYTDDEILANFNMISSIMDSAHVNYIFTGTQPRNFTAPEQQSRLLILNNKIVKAYPNHVVDVLSKLSTTTYHINEYYSAGDGVHLNDKGHSVIFRYLLRLPLFQQLFGYQYK
jgi:acyl-CoA thioesterase-1